MEEAAIIGAALLLEALHKGGDIVAGDGLNLGDAGRVDGEAGAEACDGLGGHATERNEAVTGSELNGEPAVELGLFSPDGGHHRAGISIDHEQGPVAYRTGSIPLPGCPAAIWRYHPARHRGAVTLRTSAN